MDKTYEQQDSVVSTGSDTTFQTSQPTVVMDTGNGLSSGSDSVFGFDVSETNEFGNEVVDMETIPLTEAGSAYVTPAKDQGVANDIPTVGSSSLYTSAGDILEEFSRRKAKPTQYAKGMNILVPLGMVNFARFISATDITSLNSAELSAAMDKCLALMPNLKTSGTFREVANYRRINELKNTIVGYFNRSIPFTDLNTADRAAIEMCYTADMAMVVIPILAKYKAMCLIDRWSKHGYQYDNNVLVNMSSQSLEMLLKTIYSAVAMLPSVDDILFKRLNAFSKVYTSSVKEGFAGTILEQDVTIGTLNRYKLASVSASSGYKVDTVGPAMSSKTIAGLTLNSWVARWLRSDLYSTSELEAELDEIANYAQSIRNRYSILLAAIQQLAQKGAVNYSSLKDFLPVTGFSDYILNYAPPAVGFSYAYKERVEYSPDVVTGESAEGSNILYSFSLMDDMVENLSYISQTIKFRRPVGLYKGSKAWNTKEIAEIGVFKRGTAEITLTNVAMLYGLAQRNDVNLVSTSTGNTVRAYVDAYYGDLYVNLGIAVASTTDNEIELTLIAAPMVAYYGVGNAINSKYSSYTTALADGTTTSEAYKINNNGVQILAFNSYDISAASSFASITMNQIHALLEQLDLTFFMGQTSNPTGRICAPLVAFSGYRGAFFDDFDVSVINNAMANSYNNLCLPLNPKAADKLKR